MAGGDSGIVYNGEIATEAAACQLPSIIIEDMPWWKAYYTNSYNFWNSDLNISIDGYFVII